MNTCKGNYSKLAAQTDVILHDLPTTALLGLFEI